jgi:hypothetical protein
MSATTDMARNSIDGEKLLFGWVLSYDKGYT